MLAKGGWPCGADPAGPMHLNRLAANASSLRRRQRRGIAASQSPTPTFPGRVRSPETNDLDFTITLPDAAGGILPLKRPLVAVAIDTVRTVRHA